jgi:excisionase family DNA binding protein
MNKSECMTTKDVAQALNVCLPVAYNIVNREDFPKIRFGRKIIVPRTAFEAWLNETALKGLDMKASAGRNGGKK